MEKKNTPDFSYLVGLIASDGHVENENGCKQVSICLSNKDPGSVALLNEIKNRFGGVIKQVKTENYWRIQIRDFSQYLKQIGFTNNKTFTLNLVDWFDSLTYDNRWHFLRGMWDGDGSFIYTQNGKHQICRAQIGTASKAMQSMIFRFLSEHSKDVLKRTIENKKGQKFYIVKIHKGEALVDVFSHMYNFHGYTCLHLARKYNKYVDIRNYVERC